MVERLLCKQEANGSIPLFSTRYAFVAQLVEHLIEDQGVGGSNPSEGTKFGTKRCE